MKREVGIILIVYLILCNYDTYAQCPNLDVNINKNVCINENLDIQNNDNSYNSYEWDFASGDLDLSPNASVLINNILLKNLFSIDIVEDDGNWIGFATGEVVNKLVKLSFGNDIKNTALLSDLGNLDNLFNGSNDVKIVKVDGLWYGFVVNTISNNLLLLNFGSNLSGTPTVNNLTDLGEFNKPSNVDFVVDNNNYYLFVTNQSGSKVSKVMFGNAITNVPTVESISITGGATLRGIKFTKDCENWYGIVNSYGNNKVFKLDFGNNLGNSPLITQIIPQGFSYSFPSTLSLNNEGGKFFCYIQSRFGDIYKVDFGNSMSNTSPTTTNLGKLGLSDGVIGYTLVNDGSNWVGFSMDFVANNLNRIDFPNDNSVTQQISFEKVPREISYTQTGEYYITIKATDQNEGVTYKRDTVNVSSSIAPDIEYIINAPRCATVQNSFSGTNNSGGQTITTWNWDFGDGTTLLNGGPNPSHQFSVPAMQTADTFSVKLDVISNNGCANNIVQELIIYEEPVPDFNVLDVTPCTNNLISFENITPGNYGSVISWNWDFGDGNISTDENPTHQFATAGTYNVKLQASIPGCTTETNISVDVLEGASVNYNFSNDCLTNAITFTNQTTGAGITGYQWDFGDGVNSTLENPQHTYTAPGDYTITLTVDNNIGCSVTNTKSITIYALPSVAFINELACSNGGTQFTDQTTVANANVTGWLWDFGDGKTSTEQNPINIYENSGSFTVRLTSTSNFGCESFLEITVDVISGPTVDFSTGSACLGETTVFEDLSVPANGATINSWFWEIDGEVFTVQNPQVDFNVPGTYPVSLTITSSTFCTSTITKDVVINPLPLAAFNVFDACTNSIVQFGDQSVAAGDEIIVYNWNFASLGTSAEASPTFVFNETGNYQVDLTITTVNGCIAMASNSVIIEEKPTAEFITDVNQGPPPLAISFQSTSTGASALAWDFGTGNNDISDINSPIFTYVNLGIFETTLIATANNGCTDTASQSINVVDPNLDLAIENITPVIQDNKTQLVVDLKNNGTLFIDEVELSIGIGSEATINETITQRIAPGESFVYVVGATITNTSTILFICATATPNASGFEDANLVNNTFCVNLENKTTVIKPYPNPSDQSVTIAVILKVQQKVKLSMYDAYGRPVVEEEYNNTSEGLNQYEIDVSTIADGMYLVKLQYGGLNEVFRVFVEK